MRPSIPPVTLQDQYDLILTAIHDEDIVADAAAVLRYCGGAIEAEIGWPTGADIDALRPLRNGYGCWLDDVAGAMEKAPLENEQRTAWRAAFNAAKGVLLLLHIPPAIR